MKYFWKDSFYRWKMVWLCNVNIVDDILSVMWSFWWKYWLYVLMSWKVVTHGSVLTTPRKFFARNPGTSRISEIASRLWKIVRTLQGLLFKCVLEINPYQRKNRSSASFTSLLAYAHSCGKSIHIRGLFPSIFSKLLNILQHPNYKKMYISRISWICHCSQTSVFHHLYLYRLLMKLHGTVRTPNVKNRSYQTRHLCFDGTVLVLFLYHRDASEGCW